MDQDRLRWITRPATLDSYEIKVDLGEAAGRTFATVWAGGRCRRKRGYLWTHTETFELLNGRYGIHDVITHLSMVAEQDRPTSNAELTRGLAGAAWEQPELPW